LFFNGVRGWLSHTTAAQRGNTTVPNYSAYVKATEQLVNSLLDKYASTKIISVVHATSFHFYSLRCAREGLGLYQYVIEERQICASVRRDDRYLVIPGVATRNHHYVGVGVRPQLIFFHGLCTRSAKGGHSFSGNLLRYYLVEKLVALQNPDIFASCHGEFERDEMLQRLANTTFCPVLPGDSPSARRLSEVIAAGCIPLVIGPPYNELPWRSQIDYFKFAIFITIDSNTLEKDQVFQGPELGSEHWMRSNVTDSIHSNQFLAQISRNVRVQSISELVSYLRALPKEKVLSLQNGVRDVQHRFLYDDESSNMVDAATAVFEETCRYALGRKNQSLGHLGA
jgi:hypothetical protein